MASKMEIRVFPFRAGGAVSVTKTAQEMQIIKKKLSTKCLKKCLVPFSGVTYFFSVLPFLSAVQQGVMGTAVQVLSSQITVEM